MLIAVNSGELNSLSVSSVKDILSKCSPEEQSRDRITFKQRTEDNWGTTQVRVSVSDGLTVMSCLLFQYVEEDEFVDAIKALSSGKKEHTMFTDTHL